MFLLLVLALASLPVAVRAQSTATPTAVPVPAQTSEAPAAARRAETIAITASEPVAERPPATTRPTFRWTAEAGKPGLTYDLTLFEVALKLSPRGEVAEAGEPRVVFENKGLKETAFAYPRSAFPLDKTKFYLWAVVANDSKGNQVGRTITPVGFLPFPSFTCLGLFVLPLNVPPTFSFCQQSSGNFNPGNANNVSWFLWSSASGAGTATLTDPNGVTNNVNLTCSPFGCSGALSISWPATQPGTYQWTLTVKKGTCTRSRQITLNIYPSLKAEVLDYPSGTPPTSFCWGDDATLKMKDANGNPPPAGCSVTWEYFNGTNWKLLGQGNPFNTNPIDGSSPLFPGLTCPGQNITLQFRGTLDPKCFNLPSTGWPSSCSNVQTTSLTIDCPTQAGAVTIPQKNPQGGICSNGNYPVNVTPTLGLHTGNVTGWTVNGAQIPNSAGLTTLPYSITAIMGAGPYQFCAEVKNGACTAKSACDTVIVEDPIKGTIQVTQNGSPNQTPEVCWGDDKVTMTFVPTTPPPFPADAKLEWSYQINCAGPWYKSGVTGMTQNSNDVLLLPFYPPGVNSPCNANNVCWKVTGETAKKICPPVDIGPVTINIVKPFNPGNPPVITPAQPPVKCPGQPVTLTVQNLNCATKPFSYQWFLDGQALAGETSQSINAVEPGSYTVEVCNKNKCDCIETAPVIVRDCLTLVEIKGNCTCKDGEDVILTATASSQVVPPTVPPTACGAPYTYSWSTGETTASIKVKCPSSTKDYSVEVKDGKGCKVKASFTIKRCP